MLAVKKGTFQSIEEVTKTNLKNILTVRIQYKLEMIRIIILHAPQETDSCDNRTEFFEEMLVQAQRSTDAGDRLIILGDFNARIHTEDNKVKSSSPNGKLLQQLIEENNLKVGNFSPQASGSWTRIQRKKDGEVSKSVIDYVLLQDDTLSFLESMVVDEEKIQCPYRKINTKRNKKIIFSDHCAILLSLKVEFEKRKMQGISFKAWKFTEDGYTKYREESEAPMEVNWHPDTTTSYELWTRRFEHLLSQCFTKKTVKYGVTSDTQVKKNKSVREILTAIAKKGKAQRKIVLKYLERLVELETRQDAVYRTNRLKHTMSILTEEEKFSPNGFWKMKKAADRNVGPEMVYSVLKENGAEVSGEKAINDAYKEEFKHRLRTREPHSGWEEHIEEINTVIRTWLEGKSESSPPFTDEEMDKVIFKLKKGKSAGTDDYPPELFINSGKGVRKSLLQILNQVKESRKIPDQWNLMKIVTIYKQKGCKKMLKYYRGIFLAIVISKIFEALIKGRIEPNLQKIDPLQAGSRTGRSAADNVFLLRGCIDHSVANKKPLYITAYDYEQAFDSLWVEKCILALKNLGVSKEMLQLIYNLNRKAKVIVKTPYGLTDMFETDPIVKQGTVLGSAMCSSLTGEYCGVNEGVRVGNMMLSSLLYVDDLIDLTETLSDREKSHLNAIIFTKQNNMVLSGTKCFGMGINSDGPLPVLGIDDDRQVNVAEEIVYLGDVFNTVGNNDGLIKDRVHRAIKAMISISSLIKETNLGIHEVQVWLLLYRSLFLSTVLFNSQTWSRLRKKDIESLQVAQLKFLKRILNLPSSTPNSFLFLELGVLPVENEINKRQLMYLHRILMLPDDDPVHQMFTNLVELAENGENNWWSQVKPLLNKYDLPQNLDDIKNLSKCTFKTMVNKAVSATVFEQLKTECASLKKTSELSYETFEVQGYLKHLYPNQARVVLKSRCKTLDLKTHNTYKYKGDTVCRGCAIADETLEHILNCGQNELLTLDTTQISATTIPDDVVTKLIQGVNRILSFKEMCDNDEKSEVSCIPHPNQNSDSRLK